MVPVADATRTCDDCSKQGLRRCDFYSRTAQVPLICACSRLRTALRTLHGRVAAAQNFTPFYFAGQDASAIGGWSAAVADSNTLLLAAVEMRKLTIPPLSRAERFLQKP
jgi:hypothetical protein